MTSRRRRANTTQPNNTPQPFTTANRRKTQSSSEPYKYTPLRDDDEIRLLRIAPRKNSTHAVPQASIRHVYLSDSPLYTAVSWRWGSKETLVNLDISGRVLRIQENLSRILSDLQDNHQPRYLWVDAVCIDQNSNIERNHQVQLMGRIYSEANYVIACLMAEQPQDRKRLARTAEVVYHKFQQGIQDRAAFTASSSSIFPSKYQLLFGNYMTRSPYEYQLFFENPYFTRRWIIQEVIQARSVTLCCEGYQMPMSILENMFEKETKPEEGKESTTSYMRDMMNSRAMRLCRLRHKNDRKPSPLEELLYTHEAAKCADFRDQVYALLSLTKHAKDHLSIKYEIGRAELMLSVVIVCSSYEQLSPYRTLNFTYFLQKHLRVEADDIRHARLHPPPSTANKTVALQGVVRGTVVTHRVSLQIENAARQVRKKIPFLGAPSKIILEYHQPNHGSTYNATTPLRIVHRQPSRSNEHEMHTRVSGIDQCLFAFTSNDSSNSSTEDSIIAGLASTRVDLGDEIWQFEKMPLAVVARPTEQGYDLVGRGYLLQKLSTSHRSDLSSTGNNRSSSSNSNRRSSRPYTRPSSHSFPSGANASAPSLNNDLVLVKDAKSHSKQTPIIDVDVRGLLELITWATYDAPVHDSGHLTSTPKHSNTRKKPRSGLW